MKLLAWIFGGTLALLLLAGVVAFFGVGYFLSPQDKLAKADVIVAISGGETSSRAAEAVQLYKAGWAKHVIFSGAAQDTSGPSNAAAMATEAEAAGVPKTAIELDETSADTRANAANVKTIVKADSYKSLILVTSPYHQLRASLLFHRALPQVAIINHSASDQTWSRSQWWATAASRELTRTELQKVIFELFRGDAA